MNETVIIILAAGESSRMKEPKQLLPFKGKTLLKHTIDEALNSGFQVIVVLGANEPIITEHLEDNLIPIVFNKNWKDGIATSIKAGLAKAIEKNTEIENCILCVCDQPYISANLFKALSDKKKTSGKKIVASSYAATLGTPVLFDKKYFDALLNLQGNEGAKKLLSLYEDDIASISFEKGELDIDTKSDYEKFIEQTDR
ncbi:MAG: nucleotidyltransferase family protein [Ginsengibacter sp.]